MAECDGGSVKEFSYDCPCLFSDVGTEIDPFCWGPVYFPVSSLRFDPHGILATFVDLNRALCYKGHKSV